MISLEERRNKLTGDGRFVGKSRCEDCYCCCRHEEHHLLFSSLDVFTRGISELEVEFLEYSYHWRARLCHYCDDLWL